MAKRSVSAPVLRGIDHPDVVAAANKATKKRADHFHRIHDSLLDELSTLRCVHLAIESADGTVESEELSAASAALRNVRKRLDNLCADLEAWELQGRRS
jgi:hypothetical protein